MRSSSSYKIGDTDTRPWGMWRVTDVGNGYIVKFIRVEPGQRLSLQSHEHRSERWIVVAGTNGLAEVDNNKIKLEPGVVVEVPLGARHRLSNRSTQSLDVIEIQIGTLLIEGDIERLEDDYNRPLAMQQK